MNAAEFLHMMYGNVERGWLETCFLAPKDVRLYPKTVVLWRPLPLGEIDPKMPKIMEMNTRGYGCYFGVAVRKARKFPEERIDKKTGEKYTCRFPRGWRRDALYLTALWGEVDLKDWGNEGKKALEFVEKINPSIIVSSGGGYHIYMLLDEPLLLDEANAKDAQRALKGIGKAIKGDPKVAELARVFRLPDTINTKPGRNGARCEVLEANGTRYSFDTLYKRFAPLVPKPKPKSTLPSESNITDKAEVQSALSYIPADTISYEQWIVVLAGLTHSLGAKEAVRLGEEWSGFCSQEGEIDSVVSALDVDSGGSATIGSVFWLAKQHGYTPPTKEERALSLRQASNEAIARAKEAREQHGA